MADTQKEQEEQAQEQTQTPPSSGRPDTNTDRDEVRRTSQQFFPVSCERVYTWRWLPCIHCQKNRRNIS